MDKDHVIAIKGSFTVEVDGVEPPDFDFTSRFKTVNEWLSFIVENDKTKKAIDNYDFDVFESEDDYTLSLTGTNTYQISKNLERVKIEHSPSEMYFSLPKSDHRGLTRTQVFEHLTKQLNQFMASNKFKNSFLVAAKSITTGWKGKIWSK